MHNNSAYVVQAPVVEK